MRIAVISDIHANIEALTEVMKDIRLASVDKVMSLGDNIGYGPDPEAVIRLLTEEKIPSVIGNHELAVIRPKYLEAFNPSARQALLKTIELISGETVEILKGLETFRVSDDFRFVHGFPPDSPTIYLYQVAETHLQGYFKRMQEKVCFIGHTHELKMIEYDGRRITWGDLMEGMEYLDPRKRYIINAGSVGQPRDGNNNAKYLILDTVSFRLEIRYVSYDMRPTMQKIKDLGLPEQYAERLA
jgi:predicted phosphodiesterase